MTPQGTKPLPEPVLTNHQRCSVRFTWVHFSRREVPLNIFRETCSVITFSSYHYTSQGPLSFWLVSLCTATEEKSVIVNAAMGIVQAKQNAYITVYVCFW